MIQFGTGGWRAIIGDTFIRANIQRVACALARRMHREHVADIGICIGYDRRFLSRESAIWFSEVLAANQIKTYFVNLSCPTPQIMFTVKNMHLPYGAMITASHNPAIYNGIKLFTAGGRDATQDVTDPIGEEANALTDEDLSIVSFEEAHNRGLIVFIDPRDSYLDSIMKQIDIPAIRSRHPRIVLDPMYGVSLAGLQTILYTARCDLDVINDRHDAFFGGHLPAPNPETLLDLQASVRDHHADLGIATDGDADRLGIIDEKGQYVSANIILVLLYHYLLKYKGWRGPAVRNIATTHMLDHVAAYFGQKCYEVPVGFKHISSAMDEHDALHPLPPLVLGAYVHRPLHHLYLRLRRCPPVRLQTAAHVRTDGQQDRQGGLHDRRPLRSQDPSGTRSAQRPRVPQGESLRLHQRRRLTRRVRR